MKRMTMLTIAAATLMVVAGTASAEGLTAEVPFSFTVGGHTLAPGTYQVARQSNNEVIRVWNTLSKTGALSLVNRGREAPRPWLGKSAVLSFECAGGQCELRGIWFGSDSPTLTLSGSHRKSEDRAGIEVINILAAKAD